MFESEQPSSSFPAQFLLRVAASINSDPLLPLHVPPETIAFLQSLARGDEQYLRSLWIFLLEHLGPTSKFGDALATKKLPAKVLELRERIKLLQIEKETAIADQKFEVAAAILCHCEDPLREELRSIPPIDVTPQDIVNVLRSHGYDGPMESTFISPS